MATRRRKAETPFEPRPRGDLLASLARLLGKLEKTPDTRANAVATHGRAATRKDFLKFLTLARPSHVEQEEELRYKLVETATIRSIEKKFGEGRAWEIVVHLAGLPELHARYASKWKHERQRSLELAQSLETVATQVEAVSISQFYQDFSHPFFGLVLRQVFERDWQFILEVFANSAEQFPGRNEVLKRHIYGLLLIDPMRFLPAILRSISLALRNSKPDPWIARALKVEPRGRSLREFLKHVVFRDLLALRVSAHSPNKMTAEIVNILLDAHGGFRVKPNDIAQMNKAGRRKYHKE